LAVIQLKRNEADMGVDEVGVKPEGAMMRSLGILCSSEAIQEIGSL
jgi:hypothetical protein